MSELKIDYLPLPVSTSCLKNVIESINAELLKKAILRAIDESKITANGCIFLSEVFKLAEEEQINSLSILEEEISRQK